MNFFQATDNCWISLDKIVDVWVEESTKHNTLFFSMIGDINISRKLTSKDKIEEFLSLTNITFDHEFY